MSIALLKSPLFSLSTAASPLFAVDSASHPFVSFSNCLEFSVRTNGATERYLCNASRCSSGRVSRQLICPFKGRGCGESTSKIREKGIQKSFRRKKHERRALVKEQDENGSGNGDTDESPAQVTVEQSKRILTLQKELLAQIAERKKLVSALKENLSSPAEQIKAYENNEDSKQREAMLRAGESHSQGLIGKRNVSGTSSSDSAVPREARKPHGAVSEMEVSMKPLKPQNPEITGKIPTSSGNLDEFSLSGLPRTPNVPFLPPELSRGPIEKDVFQEVVLEEEEVVPKESLEELELAAAAGTIKEKPPPLAGPNVMNVIVVAAECAPWSKTGGLGDVAGALPKALARRGHRVMVVTPRYAQYEQAWQTNVRKRYNVGGQELEVSYFHCYIDGVDNVFIDNSSFHGVSKNIYSGSREEVLKRMVLFCKAAVEVPWHVPCGGVCYGDGNLVFIANDWHTALLPVYLQAYYRDNGMMEFTRSVLVIHNIAHQGRGPVSDFGLLGLPDHYIDKFRLYDPIGGEHMNIFMAGLITAHRIVAVSHGYAWECQTQDGGWGLDGVIREYNWKLRGIVNGIDDTEWSPELDAHLKSDGYTNYSMDTLETGKAACKAALQKELGLPDRSDVPMVGFIGRLDHQKGVDIIADAMHWMMDQELQLLMLGSGRADLENMLRSFEGRYRDKVRGWVGFSVKTAHRITAGCDILLMPSRFEPCGLNQLYAMRYGTVPVVHAVGGLRDTVQTFDPYNNKGTGWTFHKADAPSMIHALGNAMWTYRDFKDSWRRMQERGMSQDLSWDNAAKQYEEVLLAAKYQW